MFVLYGGAYSIKIKIGNDTYDTWTDFHLIPASKPVINPPAPNISMIGIPGSSKVIDTTELLSGSITYGLRTGTWEFIIDHDKWTSANACYKTLLSTIHGKRLLVQLSDDTEWYEGRISVSDYRPSDNWTTINFSYNLFYDLTSSSPGGDEHGTYSEEYDGRGRISSLSLYNLEHSFPNGTLSREFNIQHVFDDAANFDGCSGVSITVINRDKLGYKFCESGGSWVSEKSVYIQNNAVIDPDDYDTWDFTMASSSDNDYISLTYYVMRNSTSSSEILRVSIELTFQYDN